MSYKVTNSYALFSDSIKGSKVIALEVVPKPTAVITLVSKVGETGLEEVTHVADSTLQIGSTETITEYRYRGGWGK